MENCTECHVSSTKTRTFSTTVYGEVYRMSRQFDQNSHIFDSSLWRTVPNVTPIRPKLAHFRQQFMENCTEFHANSTQTVTFSTAVYGELYRMSRQFDQNSHIFDSSLWRTVPNVTPIRPKLAHFRQQFMENCTECHANSTKTRTFSTAVYGEVYRMSCQFDQNSHIYDNSLWRTVPNVTSIRPKLAHFRQQFMENCTECHVNSTNGLGHIRTVVVTLNQKILQGFQSLYYPTNAQRKIHRVNFFCNILHALYISFYYSHTMPPQH